MGASSVVHLRRIAPMCAVEARIPIGAREPCALGARGIVFTLVACPRLAPFLAHLARRALDLLAAACDVRPDAFHRVAACEEEAAGGRNDGYAELHVVRSMKRVGGSSRAVVSDRGRDAGWRDAWTP